MTCIEQTTIREGAKIFFEKGDDVKIHCISIGRSEIYFNYLRWRKNSINLKSKKLDPIEINGSTYDVDELTIEKAQRNDGGIYICTRYVDGCRKDTSREASVQLIFQG